MEVGGAKKVCQVEAEGGVFATVAHLVDGESGVRVDGEEASEASVRGPWGETGIVLVGGALRMRAMAAAISAWPWGVLRCGFWSWVASLSKMDAAMVVGSCGGGCVWGGVRLS